MAPQGAGQAAGQIEEPSAQQSAQVLAGAAGTEEPKGGQMKIDMNEIFGFKRESRGF